MLSKSTQIQVDGLNIHNFNIPHHLYFREGDGVVELRGVDDERAVALSPTKKLIEVSSGDVRYRDFFEEVSLSKQLRDELKAIHLIKCDIVLVTRELLDVLHTEAVRPMELAHFKCRSPMYEAGPKMVAVVSTRKFIR